MPDYSDHTRRLHQKISAVLSDGDLQKVEAFLKEFWAEAYTDGQRSSVANPYAIRRIIDAGDDKRWSWITEG